MDFVMNGILDPSGGGVKSEPPAGGTGTGGEVPEWAKDVKFPEGIEESVRYDPSIQAFIGQDKNINMGNLLKSYVHSQKLIGKDKISLPSKDAPDSDWTAVFKKLGLPDKVDEYKIEAKDTGVNEEFINKFRSAAHEAGVLPKQAEKILKFYADQAKETMKNYQDTDKASVEESVKTLKAEFGDKYDYNIQVAKQALKHYGGDEMAGNIAKLGLSSDPTLIKFLVKVGATLGDDQMKGIKNDGTIDNISLQEEIESIMKDTSGPYWNPQHPQHAQVTRKVQNFYDKITR